MYRVDCLPVRFLCLLMDWCWVASLVKFNYLPGGTTMQGITTANGLHPINQLQECSARLGPKNLIRPCMRGQQCKRELQPMVYIQLTKCKKGPQCKRELQPMGAHLFKMLTIDIIARCCVVTWHFYQYRFYQYRFYDHKSRVSLRRLVWEGWVMCKLNLYVRLFVCVPGFTPGHL